MRILIVDDEQYQLDNLKRIIKKEYPDCSLHAFDDSDYMLKYAKSNPFDVVFLDVCMPGMTGTELAFELKKINPKVNIIFVTGFSDYKGVAMDLKASGYILKPVTEEKVKRELSDLRYTIPEKKLFVQCFGNFGIHSYMGDSIHFSRKKEIELLAYLIYKNGSPCSLTEIEKILYDGNGRNTSVVIVSLKADLKRVDLDQLIIKTFDSIAINTSMIDCDYLRYLNGEKQVLCSFTGEFMAQYPWAQSVTKDLMKEKTLQEKEAK